MWIPGKWSGAQPAFASLAYSQWKIDLFQQYNTHQKTVQCDLSPSSWILQNAAVDCSRRCFLLSYCLKNIFMLLLDIFVWAAVKLHINLLPGAVLHDIWNSETCLYPSSVKLMTPFFLKIHFFLFFPPTLKLNYWCLCNFNIFYSIPGFVPPTVSFLLCLQHLGFITCSSQCCMAGRQILCYVPSPLCTVLVSKRSTAESRVRQV